MKRLCPKYYCPSWGIVILCAVGATVFWTAAARPSYAATTDTAASRRLPRYLELQVFPTSAPKTRASPPAPRTGKVANATTTTASEPKKTFALATDLIKRGRRAQAKTLLQRLARDYPKTDIAPQALVQIATIEDSLEEADNILARVILDYPNTEWAEVAWYKRGEINMLLWDYKTALKMFGQYLERNPRARQAATIRRQMVVCRLKLGDAQEAL
ncbi:tetratricopeptide repeat protein, partial [Candidatus Sumerlaeota bacterium]|nr:tetratricopeptide repeat protein [Candidatus Sumerlaeota bacterium]